MKQIWILAVSFLMIGSALSAQSTDIYYDANPMPTWQGCETEGNDSLSQACFFSTLDKFFQDHIIYPEAAKKRKLEGEVYVQFVVNTSGIVEQIKILRDIGYECGDEVVRVLQLLPPLIPGKVDGKPVSVLLKAPVYFKL